MSYLRYIKESLKNIDELCDDALNDDDYPFYIKEIQSMVGDAISGFESLIYELKLSKDKLIEATSIIEKYIDGKD
ncbi:hypothetical protein [Neisseria sicca]